MGNGRQFNKTRVCSGRRRNRVNDSATPRPAITPEQRIQLQLMQTAAILQSMRAPSNITIPEGTTLSVVHPERSGGSLGPQTAARGVGEVRQPTSVHRPSIQNGGQVDDCVVDLTIDDIIAETSVPQALSSLSTSTSSNVSAGGSPQTIGKGKRPLRGTAPTKTGAKKSCTESATTGGDGSKQGPVVQVLDVQVINPVVQPGPSHQNVVPQKEVGRESGKIGNEDNNEGIEVFSQQTHRETFVAATQAVRGWKNEILQQERAVADTTQLIQSRQAEAEVHRRKLQACRDDIAGALEEQRVRRQRIELLKGRIQAFLDMCRD